MRARHLAALAACLAAAACQTTGADTAAQTPSAKRAASPSSECATITPLPKGLTVAPAAADVPETYRPFLGVWAGRWNGDACGALAVTKVDADGTTAVLYAWDPRLGGDGNPMRRDGRIADGRLSFHLTRGVNVEYWFPGAGGLHGRYFNHWSGQWDIDMVKVAGPEAGG